MSADLSRNEHDEKIMSEARKRVLLQQLKSACISHIDLIRIY